MKSDSVTGGELSPPEKVMSMPSMVIRGSLSWHPCVAPTKHSIEPASLMAHSCTSASPKSVVNVAEKEIALMGTPITARVSPALKVKLRVSLMGRQS